jgi:hypothetical protein
MTSILMLFVLAAQFVYDENGIAFELDRPTDWVIDTCNEDSLVTISQRDGLASLSVNLFAELMWSNAFDVFNESAREFVDMGYKLVAKSRMSKGELKNALADDGAKFHFIKQDNEIKEHIFLMAVVRDNVTLLLTFYLPRWRGDQDRLNAVHSIMDCFHFLDQMQSGNESLPPLPPLK